MRRNEIQKKRFLLSILILSLALVSLVWADKGKKEMKSETPVESPVVTDQSQEKPKAESPASTLQSYKIPWSSLNAGGELNLGSTNYKMKVTTGQTVIGVSQSTNYKMGIGFWYGVPAGSVCTHRAGDVDGNGSWSLTDIVGLVNIVFKSATKPTPLCRADANGSGGNPTLTDIIYLVNKVFKSGPNPIKTGVCCL